MREILKKHTTMIHILIIVIVALLEMFLIIQNKYVFGNGGDWLIQSTAFYEYFRNLFYETGELFPDLALHIGGGQNIYYFVYYGLYSPYLFIFYLFPFVRAGDYLMITSVLNIIISSLLLYVFLQKNSYNKNQSLFGALLLLTSTSMIFFSFTFIMFIQYMPFLILGLIGTKKFIDTKKSLLLMLSIILIIITSYYFSIVSILCLCIYALYYYIKINNDIDIKDMFKIGIKYIFRILIGIMISSFLLLPVLFTILNGRSGSVTDIDFSDLMLEIKIYYLMYDANGVGLFSILWFSIVYSILYLKKENKILSIILLIVVGCPLISLILNGFLYKNGKIFVVLLPLFILLIVEVLSNINYKKNKILFIVFILSLVSSFLMIDFKSSLRIYIYCFDLLVTYIFLCLYKKNNIFIYLLIIFMLCISLCYVDYRDFMLDIQSYENVYEVIDIENNNYIKNDLNLYRTQYSRNINLMNYSDADVIYTPTVYSSTYNESYKKIFYDVFNNSHSGANTLVMGYQHNLFFNKFMGVRYLYSKSNIPYGYKELHKFGDVTLYENENVYSLGFSLSNLISYEDYNKLSFIEKILVYQNNIIIDGLSNNSNLNFEYKQLDLDYTIEEQKNVTVERKNGHYLVNSSYDGKIILSLNKPIKNQVLVIRFVINDDSYEHRSIRINNIRNTLSHKRYSYYNNNKIFDYVLGGNLIDKLSIEFNDGIYDISDIEIYTVDNSFFDMNNTTPLNIDFDRTNGDDIYGSIEVKEDGYFIFTIPYDKGYTAYVDGEEMEIEQVNDGFIGFKIGKGNHDIHLTFEAPYAKIGRIISLIGIMVFVILGIYERKKYKKA